LNYLQQVGSSSSSVVVGQGIPASVLPFLNFDIISNRFTNKVGRRYATATINELELTLTLLSRGAHGTNTAPVFVFAGSLTRTLGRLATGAASLPSKYCGK
jgi:hypothetical protein